MQLTRRVPDTLVFQVERRSMKSLGALVVVFAAALVVPMTTVAQTAFPARTVRILCPFPPGGGVDITARAIAHELTPLLGQPVVVENRPGAGGNVAAGEVARSAPDGHTLLLTLNALHAISPHLYANLPFDALKDFSFITPLVSFNTGREPGLASHFGAGPHRRRETRARQAHLCLQRQRHQPAPRRRALQGARRNRHRARALQGQRAGAHR